MLSVELHGDTLSRSAMHEVFRVSLQMEPSPVDGAPCFGKVGGASRVGVSCIRGWGCLIWCFCTPNLQTIKNMWYYRCS